jgi:Cu-processing system ATP-binding protein
MISIKNISKTFGKLKVLNEVSVDLHSGKSYALIGPNGSGKTTLIKSLLGLVLPAKGEIFINNENVIGQWKYREQIGYMPQIGRYPDNMKIGQLFDMVKNIRKEVTVFDEELIHSFGLHEIYDKRMHTLSGGTRQKVSAAIAFLFAPPILILDEPTSGLDPVSVEQLKEKIQKENNEGKLIIITSHIMSDLDDIASEVIYLFEGNIVYRNNIRALKNETGYERLGKAVSHVITQHHLKSQPVSA